MRTTTGLGDKMRQLADRQQFAPDHPLRTTAADFDEKSAGWATHPQTVTVAQMVGAWARARKVWCEHTGEPLL